ncbi:transcriptional repressor LexA [Pelosinus sp. UFO1]|uniref:transcriptional repressor LexA n=1 Tax=Pelosinus sp. UFO1 TaxID=484770 RepID=UPI0004D1D3F9|nr:transcriptional repressor LexA [Pelosinus sp. UFO1]AIF51703.1 SOS-response transcriptional repressor, LexA [Pelosinus sp. UFO1]
MDNEDRLTTRQNQILAYIKDTLHSKGYPPSVREIGKAVGLSSSSTVHSHLAKIEEMGFIRRDPTKPRAIEILGTIPWRQDVFTSVPLVGRVTAGQPILAVENIEETYALPKALIGNNEDVFMLVVQGTSMINAGILDGDYVLVNKQKTANNNDIVVALLDDEEATVKRFFKEKDYIRLQPENDSMSPIYSRNVSILGKVIGVFRSI